MQKTTRIDKDITWSNSAKILDMDAVILAKALHNPKIVGVKIVGDKTIKSMQVMLKTAPSPNLVIKMHRRITLGEFSYQTINNADVPTAANALIEI